MNLYLYSINMCLHLVYYWYFFTFQDSKWHVQFVKNLTLVCDVEVPVSKLGYNVCIQTGEMCSLFVDYSTCRASTTNLQPQQGYLKDIVYFYICQVKVEILAKLSLLLSTTCCICPVPVDIQAETY